MSGPLPPHFFADDARVVAPKLLNKVLLGPNGASGRIVEVEAYRGGNDPGSHAWRGRTPRTEVMFGPPGRLYVYFTYGMHWCANVVCEQDGVAAAVLLRALAPMGGLDLMRALRPAARTDRDLCNGPAKLCQSLGIDGSFNGAEARVYDDGHPPPEAIAQTTRIGLSRGTELQWRWYVATDSNISRPHRPHFDP